jgi:hypothetical protein
MPGCLGRERFERGVDVGVEERPNDRRRAEVLAQDRGGVLGADLLDPMLVPSRVSGVISLFPSCLRAVFSYVAATPTLRPARAP